MTDLSRKIEKKEARKIKARAEKEKGVWFGLVGWSVAIPTLLFLGIGIWIDTKNTFKILVDSYVSYYGCYYRMFECLVMRKETKYG
ncbi:ATP synthase protein 1 [Candidatus Scalindua japonica]|uniref:ATP synthase protein 1 n=1 Tax=Candidatus Scalindua japonica TaxID=1284222 RepID=A0A286U065_9BACT|nr:hypothetical protein [Candidatus Scalindua japonica]GAX61514.1 ATP synthase protein 1 [Candidatus Scalindua japonica]